MLKRILFAAFAALLAGQAVAQQAVIVKNPVTGATLGTDGYPFPVTSGTPSANSTDGFAPISSASVEAAHVLKASAGNLYAWQATTGASAGYVMLFNATSAPADGAVTPVKCVAVAANSTVGSTTVPPEYFSTGITVVFSTTGCFTKTASATAFFTGDVK